MIHSHPHADSTSDPPVAPTRIAYVINSLEGGGAASPVPAIVDVLRRAGAEVRVFALTRRDGRGYAAIEAADIPCAVRDGGERDHWRALRWLIAELTMWRPTHIWTSLTRATLLGQLAGVRLKLPVISWQHSVFLKPANRRLLRWTRRLSVLWVADSSSVAAMALGELGISRDRLTIWPIFRANPDAPQAAGCEPGETLRIGSLGRLHPVKGYEVLIKAAAALRMMDLDFEVVICGEGTERAALEAMAEERGLGNVRFLGYASDPASFLAGLHLYVQPSWSEGFCIAAHEAMQAGLPVIASAVGELERSIEPGISGDLTLPGSVELLARKIAWWARDRERLAEMGANARDMVVGSYGPDAFEAAGRAVVGRLLNSSPSRQ